MASRGSVRRNTLWNVGGQGVSLLIGFAAMPLIVRQLGAERFGVLALVWAVLGYFALFDFGLGRATTKFVAEEMERDRAAVGPLVSRAVLAQGALGVAGALLLAGLAPLLVGRVLVVPAALQPEARAAFYALAAALPFVLLFGALRAALEGTHRFDLVNLIRTPATAATFVVPAVLAPFGVGLVGIVAVLGASRLAAAVAAGVALVRTTPGFRWSLARSGVPLDALWRYGGWVAVSNTVNPLVLYLDRFLLGALAGVGAVAYYAAPFEVVTRLLIVPGGLTAALFPTLTALLARGADAEARRLVRTSLAMLGAGFGLVALVLVPFAEPLLALWLGAEFAAAGAAAVRWLAVGVGINALAHVPNVWVYSAGRPDLPAKFQLAELPLYAAVAWWLIGRWGVTGAAAAWTARAAFDAVLVFAAVTMLRGGPGGAPTPGPAAAWGSAPQLPPGG